MRGTTLSIWAVAAVGLVLLGCGGDETVASRSAAAFREAKQRGEPLRGDGQVHGPGALTPGGHHEEEQVAEHQAGAEEHDGHAASPAAQPGAHAGHQVAATPPASGAHAGHAAAPLEVATEAEPGQPAETLAPDSLDAPAATSVAEAARAAALATEMRGGHGHGTGAYRQQDAGREPTATPPAESHQHQEPPADHDATDERRDDG